MTGTATILRELHRLRCHIKNLSDEIERLPKQINAAKGKVARAEDALRQAQDYIKKLKVTNSEKEKALKAKTGDANKYQKQRDEATVKKEYDALQHELAAAQAMCQQLEDEILAGLMEVDERTAGLPALEKGVKQAKDDLANFDQISSKRKAELTEELQKTQQLLKEAEPALPEDIQPIYARGVKARGHDAMALVQDKNCTACYTSITAQQFNELSQGDFVPCKSCGRFLYLAE